MTTIEDRREQTNYKKKVLCLLEGVIWHTYMNTHLLAHKVSVDYA